MNTLNTKTEGSTNPISKHKDSFNRPSKVSPSWSFSVMLIALIISRVNSPPLGAYEKSKKELQYPAACGGVVY